MTEVFFKPIKNEMKKYTMVCIALCGAMVFTGCKSSETAYKQAYLKAKQQEEAQQQQQQAAVVEEAAVVTPMVEKVATNTQTMDNADNILVKQESVSMVSGSGLKTFSVVIGSFLSKANAEGQMELLKKDGYDAQVVKSEADGKVWYRVVATTFDTKTEAAASKNSLMGKFPGAWLLYAK